MKVEISLKTDKNIYDACEIWFDTLISELLFKCKQQIINNFQLESIYQIVKL
jgi:hypothetical protein